MIKLFTLNNITSSSEEALYKIVLSLDPYGLNDNNVYRMESYDQIFEEVQNALQDGDFVLIAPESSDYLRYKYEFLSSYILVEKKSPELADIVSQAYIDTSAIDVEAHCIVPGKSVIHPSTDGLYSAFSVELLNGLCTVLPLDFGRLDTELISYIGTYLDPSVTYEAPRIDIGYEPEQPEEPQPTHAESGYMDACAKMIYALIQVDKTIAIANGEAALQIYNLYDKIQGLSDVTGFVEIVDPEDGVIPQQEEGQQSDAPEVTHFTPGEEDGMPDFQPVIDENGNAVLDDYGNPIYEAVEHRPQQPDQDMEDVTSSTPHPPRESASAKTIRHAREAMRNMNSSFGAAISEIYSATDDYGNNSYFVFVAVGDGKTIKAKKIATDKQEEADDLIYHGITVLCETVCQKVDAISTSLSAAEREKSIQDAEQKKKDEKKINPVIIAVAACVLLVAILAPVIIVKSIMGKQEETTTAIPSTMSVASSETTTEATTAANAIPGLDSTTETAQGDSGLTPAEPTASNVSASETSASVSSTSGTFTFTVFGYGHGVGLSQYGAKYYAQQGWNYAQILANYYYGTTLMMGDEYPSKISYAGTEYTTREFIACVLEAEMGSSAPTQALYAQAVAIYTFAKYYNYTLDASSMAYTPSPSDACLDAADFCIKNGLYIAYGGQPALTPFHAISAGKTTSYYNVWGGTALNYLAGGRESYCDYDAPDFKTTVTMTSAELKTLIEGNDSSISLSGDPSTWISILTHDAVINNDIGYVSTIRVGGKEFTGNEFRTKLMGGKLRSHCFSIKYTPDSSTSTSTIG